MQHVCAIMHTLAMSNWTFENCLLNQKYYVKYSQKHTNLRNGPFCRTCELLVVDSLPPTASVTYSHPHSFPSWRALHDGSVQGPSGPGIPCTTFPSVSSGILLQALLVGASLFPPEIARTSRKKCVP